MMRSGLHKPGAISFLALLFFSLFSLVPSLAKDWDFYSLQLGYIGYQRHEARQVSRVKDGSVDMLSRVRTTGAQCKSWDIDGCQPSRPRRAAVDTPPRSSFEAASMLDNDSVPYIVGDSSTFTRGVRAFKAFVVKQLDDRQGLPFSTGSAPGEAAPTRRTPPFVNSSMTPVPEEISKPCIQTIQTTPTKDESQDSWVFSHLRESWQQACRVGSDYYEIAQYMLRKTPTPPSTPDPSMSQPTSNQSENIPAKAPENGKNADPSPTLAPTQPPDPTATAAGQPKGAGRDPEHMRGSCMAIVIGLVAGVMWF